MSLLTIARCAGVSVSTISRALKNDAQISPATRERVRRLADELGYRPDPIAAVLAQNRWQTPADFAGLTLAYVHCTPPGVSLHGRNLFLEQALAHAVRERGYRLDVFNLCDYPSSLALSRVLYHRGIRGVLLAPVYWNEPRMDLEWKRFSVLSLGPGYYPLPLHRVYFSAYEQTDFAIRQTWNAGYRRIGVALMRHPSDFEDDHKRFGAVLANQRLLREQGGRVHLISYPVTTDREYWTQARRLRDWFNLHRPEVVIGFSCLVYHSLRETLTLRCPEDYGFVNLHWEENYPDCTGLAHVTATIARCGLQMLEKLLHANETGLPAHPLHCNVDFTWREGHTLPLRSRSRPSTVPANGARDSFAPPQLSA